MLEFKGPHNAGESAAIVNLRAAAPALAADAQILDACAQLTAMPLVTKFLCMVFPKGCPMHEPENILSKASFIERMMSAMLKGR